MTDHEQVPWSDISDAICIQAVRVGRVTALVDDEGHEGIYEFMRLRITNQHGEETDVLMYDDTAKFLADALTEQLQ